MKTTKTLLAVSLGLALSQVAVAENAFVETVKKGDLLADFRLRYETNDTDDATDSATALTLRSRVGYETPSMAGFKVLAELEDVRAIVDEYRIEDADYDVVADPENTEINRFQVSYSKDNFGAVVGRQRIILDNARFIGNVGWRQNEQTYDAALFTYKMDDVALAYAYIDQVNDILFNSTDLSAHALNAAYTGLAAGKLVAYAYLADMDDTDFTLNTYGASFTGKTAAGDTTVTYRAELATQNQDAGGVEHDALYYALEAGVVVSGVTLALGNETLGSDDGEFGFNTPFATKHAFNGWADQFLTTPGAGLDDRYLKVSAQRGPWTLEARGHLFSAADGGDDYGQELDLRLGRKVNPYLRLDLFAAAFDGEGGFDDVTKLWFMVTAEL